MTDETEKPATDAKESKEPKEATETSQAKESGEPKETSEPKEAEKPAPKKRDPIKLWTVVTLTLLVLMFVGRVISDKFVPYTANARIEAYIIPMAAEVSGRLSKTYVTNNAIVEEGDKLVEIDAEKYQFAVEQAQADLQTASQATDADVAGVATAQAKVTEAEANLLNSQIKGARLVTLSEQGAASISRADDARSRITTSEAQLESAKSELIKAKSNLGATGKDNARIKAALTNLQSAQLDLSRATVRAPSDGIVSNFTIDVGHFANTGAPIMTFISIRDVWIEAAMRENSLGHIESGNPVEIILDAAPGRIFKGAIRSVAYGVSDDTSNQMGGLTTVKTTQGWMREAQHFPVIIDFSDEASKGFKRAGGQANIIVYTGDNGFLNKCGKLWIRLMSQLSHLY
tara:strand:- start:1578 stop:2783 length:1206 start_codon:yes stop_codon:yes gene_type:complete